MLKKLPILFLLWFFYGGGGEVFAQSSNQLQRILNQPTTETETLLTFEFTRRPLFEIQENLKARVLILKLRNVQLGELPNLIVFQDPLLAGIEIIKIKKNEVWAKLKTKHPGLLYRVIPQQKNKNKLTIRFNREVTAAKSSDKAEVVEMFRELNPNSERLLITLDRPVQYDVIRDQSQPGGLVKVRLLAAKAPPDLIVPSAKTKMIKSVQMEQRGKYLLFTLAPARFVLKINQRVIKSPEFQIILSISEDKTKALADIAIIEEKKKQQAAESDKEQLERERFMAKKFEEAEYQFRLGNYSKAGLMFKNIYNFSPLSEMGVRAAFRSADSYYQVESVKKEDFTKDHAFVLQEYRIAINTALTADLGYEDVPRAYYNMGRILLSKKLYTEAFNFFEIILQLHPNSPFSKEALFQKGVIQLSLQRYDQTIETLQAFISENSRSRHVPGAYYKVGEAQFQLNRFADAKKNFDKAWSMDEKYMKSDPVLMFHMGEAYFENKDYQTARSIYEDLIDLYPKENFSNLVAIRIGDFLREEGKYEDAIKAYEKAIVSYAKELLLIGKMRIANIYAERPEEKEYKKALAIYDFVIHKHPFSDQVEEAWLRKGLTQSLFQEYPKAVDTMEGFCKKYPKNIYVKNGILHDRLLDTISAYITDYYDQRLYLEALSVWEKYENNYYYRPQSSACYHLPKETGFGERTLPIVQRAPLFLIADSYYRLGLHTKALSLYDEILKNPQDPLAPLAWFNKGQIYDSLEKPEESQQIYSDWIVKFPQHTLVPYVKKAFGDAYYKVHKFDRVDKAIRIYNQTIRDYRDSVNPLDREVIVPCYFALGNLYQAIGKYDQAIDSYKKVISMYEHPLQDKDVAEIVVDTHFILGNLYYELSALPESLAAYNEAIALFPASEKTPWAKYQKGQIYIKYNQKEKALKIFEELIEQAKKQPEALWGSLAVESHKMMVNDLKFDQWLGRKADPTITP